MNTTPNTPSYRSDERMAKILRRIYQAFGYQPYRMSKFEEYELYAQNKDFLGDANILTFTDTNGKLMALKPDVTLSIVKNLRRQTGVQKVFYNENVYRVSHNSGTYREIMQVGLECIGEIGRYEHTEALYLALKSLQATERQYRLDISHMGLLTRLVDRTGLYDEDREELLTCIRRKNPDGIRELFQRRDADASLGNIIAEAAQLYGSPSEVLPTLRGLLGKEEEGYIAELEQLCESLSVLGYEDKVGIDLSIVNDMSYYRSLVFRGYVDGVPDGVLIGGCYDSLMKKMGRDCGAIGFALSLDLLEALDRQNPVNDPDVLIIYDINTPSHLVLSAMETLLSEGKKAVALSQRPDQLTAASVKLLSADGTLSDLT